ncbi:hypothetical protein HMPREF9965_1490 [Streptococcus mitis bv. 2 str. SK95]|uniref:Uncharacterized protein n=1 Tax=Streptococcus mitis bv. 2 str. SK95 TaxID=1000588 RepID=F9LZ41_STROR|nr:hypothetical protein HMPREF9965_1490 [Streptococcus mitis bv. 2 str. SK95]
MIKRVKQLKNSLKQCIVFGLIVSLIIFDDKEFLENLDTV